MFSPQEKKAFRFSLLSFPSLTYSFFFKKKSLTVNQSSKVSKPFLAKVKIQKSAYIITYYFLLSFLPLNDSLHGSLYATALQGLAQFPTHCCRVGSVSWKHTG